MRLSKAQITRLVERFNRLFAGYLPPVALRFKTGRWREDLVLAMYYSDTHEIVFNPRYQDRWTSELVAHELTHVFVPTYVRAGHRNRVVHGPEFRNAFDSVRGFVEELSSRTPVEFLTPLVENFVREVDDLHIDLVNRRDCDEIAKLGRSHWRRVSCWDEWWCRSAVAKRC